MLRFPITALIVKRVLTRPHHDSPRDPCRQSYPDLGLLLRYRGASIARLLSSRGCSIIINYPFPGAKAEADAVLSTLPSSPPSIAIEADLSSPDGASHLVQSAAQHFPKVDILINNAGVADDTHLADITLKNWDRVVNLNARGTLLLTQAVLPHLSRKNSRIINIVSATARDPAPGMSLYAGSKAMVDALTKCWARELPREYGCTVNAVVPGPIASPMMDRADEDFKKGLEKFVGRTPVEARLGKCEEVA